jgi:hypothetical protein
VDVSPHPPCPPPSQPAARPPGSTRCAVCDGVNVTTHTPIPRGRLRVAARFIAMQRGNAFQLAAAGAGAASGPGPASAAIGKMNFGALRSLVSSTGTASLAEWVPQGVGLLAVAW